MIQHPIPTWQDLSWQDELKSLITEPAALIQQLELNPDFLPLAEAASRLFPLRVTPSFVRRMKKSDPTDPLLKQVLPVGLELDSTPGFSDDPLEEASFNPVKGLVHKYANRVLIIASSTCAINCRYCFRRSFDYKSNRLSKQDWQAIVGYISARPEIDEVIFSGGDPLLHSDGHFEWVLNELDNIASLERVRIHSRLPIVLPSRITISLLEILSSSRLQAVLVVHCNHAAEIDQEVGDMLSQTRQSGISVLNQSVLLKGINNDIDSQVSLAKRLFEFGTLPYYLHMLDKVNGSAHFEVSENEALDLYNQMRARLPGYLLAKLVREQAGECAKTVISPK